MIPTNQVLTHNGKQIIFSKVSLKTENLWMIWATQRLPNPLAAIKSLDGLPPELAKEIAVMAYKDFKKGWSLTDPEITNLKQSPVGFMHAVAVLLMVGNNWNEEQAYSTLETLVEEVGMEKLSEIIAACAGAVPSFLSPPPEPVTIPLT